MLSTNQRWSRQATASFQGRSRDSLCLHSPSRAARGMTQRRKPQPSQIADTTVRPPRTTVADRVGRQRTSSESTSRQPCSQRSHKGLDTKSTALNPIKLRPPTVVTRRRNGSKHISMGATMRQLASTAAACVRPRRLDAEANPKSGSGKRTQILNGRCRYTK